MRLKRFASVLPLALLLSGCPKGSALHKVTVAQHSFLVAVSAFEDAEMAENAQGFIQPDMHVRIQAQIEKVALAGKDLDLALSANATATTIKAKLDNIYVLLDSLNADGVLGVKNPVARTTLEVALDSIKIIIDNALVQVTP
jgi:hypothetical protein